MKQFGSAQSKHKKKQHGSYPEQKFRKKKKKKKKNWRV